MRVNPQFSSATASFCQGMTLVMPQNPPHKIGFSRLGWSCQLSPTLYDFPQKIPF
jgi:hypothetical protein